jgi:uncharacterized protein (TIGR00369 family)
MIAPGNSGNWQSIRDGPFAGWLNWKEDPFEILTGLFYFKTEDDGHVRGVFFPEGKHLNCHGTVHGGALLTFVDAMAGSLVNLSMNGQLAVTVSLNSEFMGTCASNAPVYANGSVIRATGSLVFVQGQLEQNAQPILTFSLIMKKLTPHENVPSSKRNPLPGSG